MKVKWFRVKNFRGVSDSGVCYVDENVTVLAGKNESGKSTILFALEQFTNGRFGEYDVPLDVLENLLPEVTVSFEISKDELEARGVTVEKPMELVLRRGYGKSLEISENPVFREFPESVKSDLIGVLPNFVLFSSFNDVLPNQINIETQWGKIPKVVDNLFSLSGVSLIDLKAQPTEHKRKRIANRVSLKIEDEFLEIYTQNEITIKCEYNNGVLSFYIYGEDGETPFMPWQRSKGLQWFISFYISMKVQSSANSIILIDEPGLYLHPKAQEDVLELLEVISESSQVVFTTHSPYLINPDRLERVRLVSRNEESRTVIQNKSHVAKGVDKDTMTPIITAIGLDLTKSLTLSSKFSILVEGISDYYYLEAMRRYVSDAIDLDDIQFIPNIGARQMHNMAALLIGWGIQFKALLDTDREGSLAAQDLKKLDIHESDGRIVYVHEEKDWAIEDLFTLDDFDDHVLQDMRVDEKNSEKVKGMSKAELARNFNLRLNATGKEKIQLSEETKRNFIDLFERLLVDVKDPILS